MKVPNTATITESLQNCSLYNESGAEEGITGMSSTSDDNNDKLLNGTVSRNSLELNTRMSLPYNWEHCLDLKTEEVEVHYINRRDGVKATEDPRTADECGGGLYSDEDDDDIWYDSDESSSDSSSSRDYNKKKHNEVDQEENDNVLVVGGCKSCYMYFMVPKKAQGCPKCNGQLLRFDGYQITSPSSP